MERPFVSIVIPVFNGGAMLGELLKSISHLAWPADRFEVIVVDNGSTDDSAVRAHAAGACLLFETRRGAAHARNTGVLVSRGDIVAFTDADCIVTRGWLDALVAPFADPAVGGTGGHTETWLPKTWTERHAARTRHLDAAVHLRHPTFPFAPTANAAFRKDVFEAIGGFDPDFAWGEPIDFCKRVVRDAGARLEYAPRAVVFHRARPTVGAFYRQQMGYGYSLALLCAKYRDEVAWDWKQNVSADWDVWRAGFLVPWALVEAVALRRGRDPIENRTLEFVRQCGRRAGFRRAVRERRLKLGAFA